MRFPKRGQRGFTLIELLIVVAILGVLAAVVIPNVGQFLGAGEKEAAATELANIQTAVVAMMLDNGLKTLPNPVGVATDDMGAFPDATSNVAGGTKVTDPEGFSYSDADDEPGYVLYDHDITGKDSVDPNPNQVNVNYVVKQLTSQKYKVDASGTVTPE